jgi:ribosomal protein L37AE/L43A
LEAARRRDGEGWGREEEKAWDCHICCHVVTGHGFRPVWTCSETRTSIRDLNDTLYEFVDRDDTATQV